MKLKTSSGRLMSLLIIPISFFCACNFTKTPTAEKAIQVADSVAIYYYQSGFLSFAAISATEFADELAEKSIVIRDAATVRRLENGLSKLKVDSVRNNLDVRIMLVFYKSKNDTLWVSALKNHNMQLNRQIMQKDTAFWMTIKQVISENDSVFRRRFANSSDAYI